MIIWDGVRNPVKKTRGGSAGETILSFSCFSFFVLCCFVSEDARWVGFGRENTIGSLKTNAGARIFF